MAMMISRVSRVNSSHPYLENDPSSSLVYHRLRIHLGFGLVLSQPGFSIYLRKRTISLSYLVGSVVGGGGSDGQGQVRSAAGVGNNGKNSGV